MVRGAAQRPTAEQVLGVAKWDTVCALCTGLEGAIEETQAAALAEQWPELDAQRTALLERMIARGLFDPVGALAAPARALPPPGSSLKGRAPRAAPGRRPAPAAAPKWRADQLAELGVRPVPVSGLYAVCEAAWAAGRVPLLLEPTGTWSSSVFVHRQCVTIDGARVCAQRLIDRRPAAELRAQLRREVLSAVRGGLLLLLQMGRSACRWPDYYDDAAFPSYLWDPAAMAQPDALRRLELGGGGDGGDAAAAPRAAPAGEGYRVAVCSNMGPDEYREFLADALPLERCEALFCDARDSV